MPAVDEYPQEFWQITAPLSAAYLMAGGGAHHAAGDLSASGYSVTYQCKGDGRYTRLQAAILSRVLREMSSNVLRHADYDRPVTITLSREANKARLVVTNGVSSSHHNLPSSGMGILGMKERLSTIGGSLNTLMDNGTWLTSASIPLSQSPTQVIVNKS